MEHGYHVAYAYSPRENVGSNGSTHIITERAFSEGRMVREAGDALCKPSGKFWGLRETERAARCRRCLSIAERLGILSSNESAVLP